MRNWRFVWPIVLRWPLRRKRWSFWRQSPEHISTVMNDMIRCYGRSYEVGASAQMTLPPLESGRVDEDPIECD